MTFDLSWGLSEQHLLPDAVVALVDGELTPTAHARATAHAATCAWCAAEISTQRQARAAVRAADDPATPAGLLAALRAIPLEVDLPQAPDNLAVTQDGQLVTVQRHTTQGGFGSGRPFGSSPHLGEGKAVLGRRPGRRAAQGAGVVVSSLVLGALALVNTGDPGPLPVTARMESPPPAAEDVELAPAQPVEALRAVSTTSAPPPAATPSFGLVATR